MIITVRPWPLKRVREYLEGYPSGTCYFKEIFSLEPLYLPGWEESCKPTVLIPLIEDILPTFSEREKIRKTFNGDYGVWHFKHDMTMYRFYHQFEESQGRKPMAWEEFRQYEGFKAIFKGGEVLSAITFTRSPGYLRIRSMFSGPKTRETANATRRLILEICNLGYREGYKYLDMAFINRTDPAIKGITAFKMSFGGTIAYEYIYVYKSPIYKLLHTFS